MSKDGLHRRNIIKDEEHTSLIERVTSTEHKPVFNWTENVLKYGGQIALGAINTASAVEVFSDPTSENLSMRKLHAGIGAAWLALFLGNVVENAKSDRQLQQIVESLGEVIVTYGNVLTEQGQEPKAVETAIVGRISETLNKYGIAVTEKQEDAIRKQLAANTAHSALYNDLKDNWVRYGLTAGAIIGAVALTGGAGAVIAGSATGSVSTATAGVATFGAGVLLATTAVATQNNLMKKDKVVLSKLISAFEGETRGFKEGASHVERQANRTADREIGPMMSKV